MTEHFYFISDTELGRGDITDDFKDDQGLSAFIDGIAKEESDKSTLVFNGDSIDFLKMAHRDNYPRAITEEISLWKLEECFTAHSNVFDSLKNFLKDKKNHLFFVIGNHDADLAWPKVQTRLKQFLNAENRIIFDFKFNQHGVHAEHGHLFDAFFMHSLKKIFTTWRGRKILNLPFGYYASSQYLIDIKRKFPHVDQLFPKHIALHQHPTYRKYASSVVNKLTLRTLFKYPFFTIFNPTYKLPIGRFIRHTVRYGREYLDDNAFIDHRIKKVCHQNPDAKVIIMGHAHLAIDRKESDKQVIITDTWREEYDMEHNLERKPRTFAKVIVEDGSVRDAGLHIFQQ